MAKMQIDFSDMGGSGKSYAGEFYTQTDGVYEIPLGFKPSYIAMLNPEAGSETIQIYNADADANNVYFGNLNTYTTKFALGGNLNFRINSITNNGFKINKSSNIAKIFVFAKE